MCWRMTEASALHAESRSERESESLDCGYAGYGGAHHKAPINQDYLI